MKFHIPFAVLLCFALGSSAFALQLEGGANYSPVNNWHPFGALTVFPWGQKNREGDIWRGTALEITYEERTVYTTVFYGSAELGTMPMQTIYLGLKADVTRFQSMGIQLKGTAYYLPWFPASLSIDPKYNWKDKEFVWDFKMSVGIGKHLSWN